MDNNADKALAYAIEGKTNRYDKESQQWFSLKTALAYLVNDQWEKAIELISPLKDLEIGGNLYFPARNFNLEKSFSRETTFQEVLFSDIKKLQAQGIEHPNLEKMKNYLGD